MARTVLSRQPSPGSPAGLKGKTAALQILGCAGSNPLLSLPLYQACTKWTSWILIFQKASRELLKTANQ